MSKIGDKHCSCWFKSSLKNIQATRKRIEILWSSTEKKLPKNSFCRIWNSAQAYENV